MKFLFNRWKLAALLALTAVMISSCAPEIKLTSSWTNNQAKVKSSPAIMVIALGKANSSIRQDVENSIVNRLKKYGYNAHTCHRTFSGGCKA
jgi:intracellular sulfur oxidation DsrE/DsrF family protein